MKTVLIALVLLGGVTVSRATDPEGFGLWKNDAIQKTGHDLEGKIDDQKFAFQQLGNYDNHMIGISHRAGDGSAEMHETQVDIFFVEAGEAMLVLGGKIIEPKTVKSHEIRGTSIEGGTTVQLTPGDIVHIPVKVPHQLKIAPGKTFTYTVVKVDAKQQ
jgi:mannose-6-phosphate isomerase-like protein (cupin superfamily)